MWPEKHTLPRPSGIPEPSWWERTFPSWLTDGVYNLLTWGEAHLLWVISGLLLILVVKFWVDGHSKRKKEIERLWLFLLFFLSKRQMMMPLLVTLGRREKDLSEKSISDLLKIREKCRTISLRKSPKKRMAEELKVSAVLYRHFSQLEKKGKINDGSKLGRVMQDLEFIDQKLVQLQKTYNTHAEKWNQNLSGALKIFGFKPFEKFEK